MISLIANALNADISAISEKSRALLEKTDALKSNATRLEDNAGQNRNVIDRHSKSIPSKGGQWNLAATAMLQFWRGNEKKLDRQSWRPAIAETKARLKDCRPPAGLESQPDLDITMAESRAEKIPPLTRDLEEKTTNLTHRIQSITESSRRVLEACEALRNG